VEHPELAWLFAIDAEGDGRDHHPDWRDLFVKAALCHVVGRRAPAVLEAEVMQARAARFEQRSRVSPFSVFSSLVSGGFSGFWARMRAAGPVEALEQRYEEANAETQADAKLTAGEVAMLLGLSERDGKLTANEQALMDALEALEAEQG